MKSFMGKKPEKQPTNILISTQTETINITEKQIKQKNKNKT